MNLIQSSVARGNSPGVTGRLHGRLVESTSSLNVGSCDPIPEDGLRVVRVGTHGIAAGLAQPLWLPLAQHRGTWEGMTGNSSRVRFSPPHRGSAKHEISSTTGKGESAPRDVRDAEQKIERAVTAYIGGMPFLWLRVEDDPSPNSLRSYIEPNPLLCLAMDGALAELWTLLQRNGSGVIARM